MMNLLESQWFFQMVERAGKSPVDKLTAIFGITETWIAAPGIREQFLQSHTKQMTGLHTYGELKLFLSSLATTAKLEKPDTLATHLVILLQGAIVEELRNPGSHALNEAAKAAQAVVNHATPPSRIRQFARYSAAGFAAVAFVGTVTWHMAVNRAPASEPVYLTTAHQTQLMPSGASPGELEAVLALHEQIERGACPAPEFLAMPQGQVTAYMNAINLRTPENPEADRENLRAFLTWFNNVRASQCYYRPANGHTTVAWVPHPSGAR